MRSKLIQGIRHKCCPVCLTLFRFYSGKKYCNDSCRKIARNERAQARLQQKAVCCRNCRVLFCHWPWATRRQSTFCTDSCRGKWKQWILYLKKSKCKHDKKFWVEHKVPFSIELSRILRSHSGEINA